MDEKINKILLLLVLALLIIIPSAYAIDLFRQNQNITIIETVRVNDFPVDNIDVNITFFDPDGILIVKFAPMVYDTNSKTFNFTLDSANTTKVGVYEKCVTATFAELNKTSCEKFEITPTGLKLETSQSILYFLMLGMAILIFAMVLYGAIKLPWRNTRDFENKVVEINDLKFVKMFLWFMVYVIALWILALGRNITANFLFFNAASKFFNFIFWILFVFLWPTIVIFFITIIVRVLEDSKIKKALHRNLPFRK